jgi:hypothetical protein
MMAAGQAALSGRRVILLERNTVLGKKLGLTGKGRCNLTNDCEPDDFISHVVTGGRFMRGALSRFTPRDTMAFFEALGVPLKTERGRRVFPASDRAADVTAALRRRLNDCGVTVRHTRACQISIRDNAVSGVVCTDGAITCQNVLIATGGVSYPKTGSTGDGYGMARACGHTVTSLCPSLSPLEAADCSALQGLSLRNIKLSVYSVEKKIYDEQGELLFTHFGVSGPLVLSASALLRDWENSRYRLAIDCKPALTLEQLNDRMLRDLNAHKNKAMRNVLALLLHAKMVPLIMTKTGIDPLLPANELTRKQRQALIELVKNYPVYPTGFRPIEEAVVTAGGVCLTEVDPKTMESKICKRLYFAGEVLNIDALTGGYNLQIAWSTGYAAGCAMGGESYTSYLFDN